MNDIYKEQIIDHFRNPRNMGELEKADVVVRETNASCGDMFELGVRLRMQKSASPAGRSEFRIKDIKFKGVGCAISVAAFSLLTEKVKAQDLSLEEMSELTEKDIVDLLGIRISQTRMKCATLPLRALRRIISENKAKRGE